MNTSPDLSFGSACLLALVVPCLFAALSIAGCDGSDTDRPATDSGPGLDSGSADSGQARDSGLAMDSVLTMDSGLAMDGAAPDSDAAMIDGGRSDTSVPDAATDACVGCGTPSCPCGTAPVVFSVTGDVPYNRRQAIRLREDIASHNARSPSSFMMHIGDIKAGATACVETIYSDVAADLHALTVPTFVLLGDNEWNDCTDPVEAWGFWQTHFARFEEFWAARPAVAHQTARDENFAWIDDGVVMIGINMVDGMRIDPAEWDTRLLQNADWVDEQFAALGPSAYAAVIFGHTGPTARHTAFFERLETAAVAFDRPILYVNGNNHRWLVDRPFAGVDVMRVQIAGGLAPPLQVTVTPEEAEPFSLERDPFP